MRCVVFEGSHGGGEFIDHVGVAPFRMKGEMAWAAAGLDRSRRRLVGLKRSLGRVKAIDQHLVQTEICRDGEAVGRVEIDRMSMRFFLTLRVRAGAGVLDERRGLAQPAVWRDWKRSHAATSIVGQEKRLAGAIDHEMAWC